MFLPESIDLGQSEKYVLSIRIKPDSFMFSISEAGAGQNYCLRETSFSTSSDLLTNIQRIIFDYNFLTQEFKQTNVVFVSPDYDLVPALYFDAKQKEALFNFTHTDKSRCIISGLIANQDIVSLLNVNQDIFEFLSRNLWAPLFFGHSTLLSNYFEDKNRLIGNVSRVYLNFHDSYLDVICFTGPKLIYCQTYMNEPMSNQLYYILKLWEQFRFNQLEDFLLITGDPDKELVLYLQDYVKNIEFQNKPSESYLWSEDAQKAPLDLLILSL